MHADAELRADATAASVGPALVVVFLWVLLFPYSDDVAEAAFDVAGWSRDGMPWAALAVDVALVLLTIPLKQRIALRDQGATGLWGYWTIGAVLIVGLHLVLALAASARDQLSIYAGLGLNLLASAGFVAGMTLILLSTLGADPTALVSRQRRLAHPAAWSSASAVIPLLLGTAGGLCRVSAVEPGDRCSRPDLR